MNKAFFLDRDGTINKDTGYVGDPNKLELLPGAADAIRHMNNAGYLVIVISNQSGVARGFFTEDAVREVNTKLNDKLGVYGAHIDVFYYCPHHRNGTVPEYSIDCDCRKPRLGLFKRAIDDFDLDPLRCFACGDKKRDILYLSQLGIPPSHQCVVYENDCGNLNLYEAFVRLMEENDYGSLE